MATAWTGLAAERGKNAASMSPALEHDRAVGGEHDDGAVVHAFDDAAADQVGERDVGRDTDRGAASC